MIIIPALIGLLLLGALSFYDLKEGRLPNSLVICLAGAGGLHFLMNNTAPSLINILVGLVVGPGFLLLIRELFQRLRGRPGLGLGDVKFTAAAAFWVGAGGLPVLFFVASVSTLLVVGLLVLAGRLPKERLMVARIPFGPGLAFGLVFAFVLQQVPHTQFF